MSSKDMADFEINMGNSMDDPIARFSGEGVTFKAKLIGVDPVTSPRGDQMCKNAMTRLKAIVKGTGSHKQKIILSISLDGLKLMDDKTKETISQHPIPLISYISRDTSDNRAFGFVYGSPSEGHQFIGIKTEKQAIPVMQTIADLFTFVYEKRKQEKQSKEVTSPRSQENVLTFNTKEEVFSTDKVNAAWNKSEPKSTSPPSTSTSSRRNPSSPLSILPVLMPPPRTESFSSRTSTLNSQKSDVLNELRNMRQVISSAQAASKENDRYATWESFNESEANETLNQINSLNSDYTAAATALVLDPLRPPSARSTSDSLSERSSSFNFHGGSSGANRPGIAPRLPSSVMPMLVPSPPSSPRSVSGRGRARLRQGFTQPNQVALPPPMATSTLSLQSSSISPVIPRTSANNTIKNSSILRPDSSNSCSPQMNCYPGHPAQSEPDLFSQFNRTRTNMSGVQSSNDSNKFEVNFDAVFSAPTSSPVESCQVPSYETPPAPPLVPPNTGKPQSDEGGDRYACFQEIEKLASYPSIFDNPSSSSDSDTFVGSPSLVSPTTGHEQDLFGGDTFGVDTSWSNQQPVVSFPPMVPVQQQQTVVFQQQSCQTSTEKQSETGKNEVTKSPIRFVDTATSPGTPPGTNISSHPHHQNDSQSKDNSNDPFAMTAIFKELESCTATDVNLSRRVIFN